MKSPHFSFRNVILSILEPDRFEPIDVEVKEIAELGEKSTMKLIAQEPVNIQGEGHESNS